jgi:hypothetical protein
MWCVKIPSLECDFSHIKPVSALLLFGTVALDAVLLKNRAYVGCKIHAMRRGDGAPRREQ